MNEEHTVLKHKIVLNLFLFKMYDPHCAAAVVTVARFVVQDRLIAICIARFVA